MQNPNDVGPPLPPVVIALLVLLAVGLGVAGIVSQTHSQRRNPFEDLELELARAAGTQSAVPSQQPGSTQSGHASRTHTPPTPQASAAELRAEPPPTGPNCSPISREEGTRPVQIIIRDRLAPGQQPPTFEPGDNRTFIALPDEPPTPRGYREPTRVVTQPVPFGPKHPDAIMFENKTGHASKKGRISIKNLFP